MITKEMLAVLLPKAIEWCSAMSEAAGATGAPLTSPALEDARAVGVGEPERIRVLVVNSIPTPDDPLLASAAAAIGFLGSNTNGLALGYSLLWRPI